MNNEEKRVLINEHDMLSFGEKLARAVPRKTIIFLYGPLGAGKTTFTRGFLRGLGYKDKVKSPTYTLVEPYDAQGCTVFHFDFYRLHDASELEHIGIHDYFTQEAICLIEWPELGLPLLPKPDLACYIAVTEQGREVRLVAYSDIGERILSTL